MNSVQVYVRPAEVGDLDAMMAVWHAAFGPDFQGGEPIGRTTIEWLLSRASQSPDRGPWGWVAEYDGEIVGARLSLPVELSLSGQTRMARWLMALGVDPKSQRKGIGRAFYRRIVADGGITLSAGLVKASRALYVSEQAVFVGADIFGQRYTRRRRTLRHSLGRLRRGQLRESLSLLGGLVRRATDRPPAGILVEEMATVPPEIDALLLEIEARIPVMVKRDWRWLEWALSNPRCRIRLFVARRGQELCGYAMVREDGMILDLLARPNDQPALRALVVHLAGWARTNGIAELTAIMTRYPAFRAVYERAGFVPRHDFGLFFAPTGEAALDAILSNPEGWYISMADSDLWSFRLGAERNSGELHKKHGI